MVSLRESKGASSLGDSSGCVTVKALDSSSRELGRALHMHSKLMLDRIISPSSAKPVNAWC